MSPTQKNRLYRFLKIAAGVILGLSLVLYALSDSIDLFYTPTQLLQEKNLNPSVRLGGMVVKGSVEYGQGLSVTFTLTDFESEVPVEYDGILPDLFKEGQGIVAAGSFIDGKFIAKQVLAKHDENYMPPALKKQMEEGA